MSPYQQVDPIVAACDGMSWPMQLPNVIISSIVRCDLVTFIEEVAWVEWIWKFETSPALLFLAILLSY